MSDHLRNLLISNTYIYLSPNNTISPASSVTGGSIGELVADSCTDVRPNYAISPVSSVAGGSIADPFTSLSSLIATLRKYKISGPYLYRVRKEFTLPLGRGAFSVVFGVAPSLLPDLQRIHENIPRKTGHKNKQHRINDWATIAIKQCHSTASPGPNINSELQLARQVESAEREILRLCDDDFRQHRNIVKLLGWGLCLDTLEDSNEHNFRIPLLVLEKAKFNLAVFLGDSVSSTLSPTDLRQICVDVGDGLAALHLKGIIHGDIKCDNILIFEEGTDWVAKLCDFGLAYNFETNGKAKYDGTEAWRAPEVLTQSLGNPLRKEDLPKCDVYAYGLLVWSVFLEQGKAPLRCELDCRADMVHLTEDQDADRILHTALAKLATAKFDLGDALTNRIRATLEVSLCHDPKSRSLQPWKCLQGPLEEIIVLVKNTIRAQHVAIQQVVQSTLPILPVTTPDIRSPVRFAKPVAKFAVETFNAAKPYVITCWFRFWGIGIKSAARLCEPPPQIELIDTFSALFRWIFQTSEDSRISDLERHQGTACYDLEKFLNDTGRACDYFGPEMLNAAVAFWKDCGPPDAKEAAAVLYVVGRLRASLRHCCWNASSPSVEFLWLEQDFLCHPDIPFEALAWLCQGDVGQNELEQSNSIGFFPQNQDKLKRLNPSQRLERFLLLLDHGWQIEKILMTFLQSLDSPAVGKITAEICRRFKNAQERSVNFAVTTRFFMTGLLPANGSDTECKTTVLHECARHSLFAAVEQIVRSGLTKIDALDNQKATALDIAVCRQNEKYFLPERQENNDRIIGLLRRRARAPSNTKKSDLPLGWEAVDIPKPERKQAFPQSQSSELLLKYNNNEEIVSNVEIEANHSNAEVAQGHKPQYYFETFTQSITFTKPTFSLFDNRRIALGHSTSSRSPQQYYFDFISFISQEYRQRVLLVKDSEIATRFPVYDSNWYAHDAQGFVATQDIFAPRHVRPYTRLLHR